ncbi:hypothetical protein ACHAO4_009339 [Trichoderma viride]
MPRQAFRQAFSLESIPEEEECIIPTELDLLMTTTFDSHYFPVHHATPLPNTVQITSQASILAPQPQYGNPAQVGNVAYPHHYSSLSSRYEYTPPYLQTPSPYTPPYLPLPPPSPWLTSPPSPFHTAPTSPSPTVLDDYNPHQTQNLLDFVKGRTQTRLEETNLSDNFFTKWAIVTTNMFGGVIPPESKYTVPPFALPSYDGQVRLRFIGHALGISLAAPAGDIEKFLSRNLFIIMCLAFNIVPNPDLIFDDDEDNSRCGIYVNRPGGKQYNKALLRAIQQLEWTDPVVIEAVKLSIPDEVGALATLCKKRASRILPDVCQTMKKMVWEEPALEHLGSRKLHEMAVQQMRENRPYSLLRNVVKPEDVIV